MMTRKMWGTVMIALIAGASVACGRVRWGRRERGDGDAYDATNRDSRIYA